jgi:hypothetical protein
VKTGTITIHNTDLTSAGQGQGDADGDDTINITATVLQHARASFDVAGNSNTLTVDFGIIPLNGDSATRGFSVANEQGTALTAGLDLTGVSVTGSTVISTNVAMFQNLSAGSAQPFTATLDSSVGGIFNTTDVIHVSDDHTIPGALSSDLTLMLTGTVAMVGDANVDGKVDLSDLSIVLNNFGQATSSWVAGNFDGAATINLTDLSDVLNNFGQTTATATVAVAGTPEPGTLVTLAAGIGGVVSRRGRGLRRSDGG